MAMPLGLILLLASLPTVVAEARPPDPALHVVVADGGWAAHGFALLGPAGSWAAFATSSAAPEAFLNPTFDALKARAGRDDDPLRATIALEADPLRPVDALVGPLSAATRAGFGPIEAVTGAGETRIPLGFSRTACWDVDDPDERGKVDWRGGERRSLADLDLLLHGPPRPCVEPRIRLTPGEIAIGWRERWVRDRCGPPPIVEQIVHPDLVAAAPSAPEGERCPQAWIDVAPGVVWGELVDALSWCVGQGIQPTIQLEVEPAEAHGP